MLQALVKVAGENQYESPVFVVTIFVRYFSVPPGNTVSALKIKEVTVKHRVAIE